MRVLFLFTFAISVYASTISLEDILLRVKNEHPVVKSIDASKESYSAKNSALSSRRAVEFFVEGAKAKQNSQGHKSEFSIGFEQTFVNPSVLESRINAASYRSDAQLLKLKQDFLLLENNIRFFYHLNCLDKKSVQEYEALYSSFEKLYAKKEKAYKYGEISKKELLQLSLDLKRLKMEFDDYKREEKISRNTLQSKLQLISFDKEELLCDDMYKLTEKVATNVLKTTYEERIIEKNIKSVESDYKSFDALFENYSLSASYQNEIDTDRVMVGFSIPLNFTTTYNERKRAEALHKKSAFVYEKEALKLKKLFEREALEKALAQNFKKIETLSSILNQYENDLVPLIEREYRLGEDSVTEFLLSQRQIWLIKKELNQYNKSYYRYLFDLYSYLEIKE